LQLRPTPIATGREPVATRTNQVASGHELVATWTDPVATGREPVATGHNLCPVATRTVTIVATERVSAFFYIYIYILGQCPCVATVNT